MSVQERYAFDVIDVDDALAIGARLASKCGALLRWAALWTDDDASRAEVERQFESRSVPLECSSEEGVHVITIPRPSTDEVAFLMAHRGDDSVCVHWRPGLYIDDYGEKAPWITFVDRAGYWRDDARIYRIELTRNAVPFTAPDRPSASDFVWGPERAEGVRFEVQLIRDHMPQTQLRAWLAEAARVPIESIRAR